MNKSFQQFTRIVFRCFIFIMVIQLLVALVKQDMGVMNIIAGVIASLIITTVGWFVGGKGKKEL